MVNIFLNMCGQISGEGFAFSINNVGIIDIHMQKILKTQNFNLYLILYKKLFKNGS